MSILAGYLPSWAMALDGAGKSPQTSISYLDSVKRLDRFLVEKGLPLGAPAIRAFLSAERERTSAWSAQKHYRNLHVFFGWAMKEGDILDADPMINVQKPQAAAEAKSFFTEADLAALLRATQGQDFESRRDHALLRVLVDTGMRVGGLAGLRFHPTDDAMTDVFLAQRRLRIRLKGGDAWWVPVGARSCVAIDRYLRVRARHPQAPSPWLWLGTRGRGLDHFTDSGIRQMLARRGETAGVQHCHPHKFRGTMADQWLADGGTIDDLMTIAGWKSITMPLRYAAGRKIARAAEAHGRLSPGDRL
jgi:site-specific recombinase XerD